MGSGLSALYRRSSSCSLILESHCRARRRMRALAALVRGTMSSSVTCLVGSLICGVRADSCFRFA